MLDLLDKLIRQILMDGVSRLLDLIMQSENCLEMNA